MSTKALSLLSFPQVLDIKVTFIGDLDNLPPSFKSMEIHLAIHRAAKKVEVEDYSCKMAATDPDLIGGRVNAAKQVLV